jgi:hypothetical protein
MYAKWCHPTNDNSVLVRPCLENGKAVFYSANRPEFTLKNSMVYAYTIPRGTIMIAGTHVLLSFDPSKSDLDVTPVLDVLYAADCIVFVDGWNTLFEVDYRLDNLRLCEDIMRQIFHEGFVTKCYEKQPRPPPPRTLYGRVVNKPTVFSTHPSAIACAVARIDSMVSDAKRFGINQRMLEQLTNVVFDMFAMGGDLTTVRVWTLHNYEIVINLLRIGTPGWPQCRWHNEDAARRREAVSFLSDVFDEPELSQLVGDYICIPEDRARWQVVRNRTTHEAACTCGCAP